jgi:hypothetical protein
MLFDLQSRGRRGMVKVIYGFLAILIGGGLVFFGIGGSGSGLLNSKDNNGGTGGVSIDKQAQKAELAAQKPAPGSTDSQQAAAWAAAARLRFQAGSSGFNTSTGSYTQQGLDQLKLAGGDWNRYIVLENGTVDTTLAKLMAQAYSPSALNQPKDSAKAWQYVVLAEPTWPNYSQLALTAYLASQNTLGDQAAAKAVSGAPASQRKTLQAKFKAAKAFAEAQAKAAAAKAAQQSSSASPTGL